jgi:phosphatidylinositol alpha-1,6-mannosyltransferase
MIGRLHRGEDYKGHREVISAWPDVIERIGRAELWIVGDGDLRADLEAAAQTLGMAGQTIRFFGTISESDKLDLLARCRCLAMPSRAEGFGLVYVEAMRMGRPCLVSTVDAGREVVNPPEAGLAVSPDDRDGLAESLCRLLGRSEEWDQWSRQARHRYERHFTAALFQARLGDALVEAGMLNGLGR